MQDNEMSRICLMGSTHGINTARNIILQKVMESDIKDVTSGKIRTINIFTAFKKKDTHIENIHPQHMDSSDSQVQAPYLSSQYVGLLHLALSCHIQNVAAYVGDVRLTTLKILPSGEVKVMIEKLFTSSFHLSLLTLTSLKIWSLI